MAEIDSPIEQPQIPYYDDVVLKQQQEKIRIIELKHMQCSLCSACTAKQTN